MNVKGPAESFIENLRTNTALIRKFIKDENLIFEDLSIGNKGKTQCNIVYISGIANTSIINEVKRRIENIEIDYLIDSGQLEQLIEDKSFLISPLIISTERPDKVAANLCEGRVAIIVNGSPEVLIVPAVFTDFLHATEDSYVRYPYSLILRFFRIPALILRNIFARNIYCTNSIPSRNDTNRPTICNSSNKRKSPLSIISRTNHNGNII